jgi:peroxiredoxin Q/BCP
VGVNADPQDANERFRASLGLPFALVGDPEGEILRAYKVRWPIIGIAKRVTYVVGRDRKILSAFRSERDMAAHAAQACAFVGRERAG